MMASSSTELPAENRRPWATAAIGVFWLALWFALLTSLVEYGCRGLARSTTGVLSQANFDPLTVLPVAAYWITPLANLSAFIALAIALSIGGALSRRLHARRFAVFAFTLLLLAQTLGLVARTIHFLALTLLVIGLALTASRIAGRYEAGLQRLVRRTTLPLAAAVLLLATGVPLAAHFRQQRAIEALPPSDGDTANVLVITLDTVRQENMSLYGYERPTTPQLARFARQGIVLNNATTPSPWTLPTHASLFTGRLPHEHLADLNSQFLDDTFPTLAEVLRDRGYHTAAFVANMVACGRGTGLDRGFIEYRDHPSPWPGIVSGSVLWRTLIGNPVPRQRRTAEHINAEFLAWLDQRDERPFMVFLNYFDAHDPYWVPDPEFDVFSDLPQPERAERLARACEPELLRESRDPELIQVALDTYDGAIAYVDHHLGRLLDDLDRRKILQDTIVVITSDHGEHFGEHGLFGHASSVFRQLIDAPLVILPAGKVPSAGTTVDERVSLIHVPATILDLLGIESRTTVPGQSLAALWQNEASAEKFVMEPVIAMLEKPVRLLGMDIEGPSWSVMAEGLQYVCRVSPYSEVLFDYRGAPREAPHLAHVPEGKTLLASFRQIVEDLEHERIENEQSRRGNSITAARSNPPGGLIFAASLFLVAIPPWVWASRLPLPP